ncbi:MAG: hypothetical protein FWF85_03430 [Clostridiales bacterium]|nr:hypothetical protein [Clostridiales bacterium]
MKKFGFGLIILGAGFILITHIAETTIIIHMGIRAFTVLSVLPFFTIGAGVCALAAGFVPSIRKGLATKAEIRQIEMEKRVESRPTLSYSAAAYDPSDIRRRLDKLKKQRPDLNDALAACEAQLDTMDQRKAKLKDLLDLNEAEYLRTTQELLNDVEQFICKNFRKIINRGIVSDLEDDQVFAQDDKYPTYQELIEAVIASNQTELDNIKKFLADLAALVSEQNDNSETTLKSWMQVIRDSLKKEEV